MYGGGGGGGNSDEPSPATKAYNLKMAYYPLAIAQRDHTMTMRSVSGPHFQYTLVQRRTFTRGGVGDHLVPRSCHPNNIKRCHFKIDHFRVTLQFPQTLT